MEWQRIPLDESITHVKVQAGNKDTLFGTVANSPDSRNLSIGMSTDGAITWTSMWELSQGLTVMDMTVTRYGLFVLVRDSETDLTTGYVLNNKTGEVIYQTLIPTEFGRHTIAVIGDSLFVHGSNMEGNHAVVIDMSKSLDGWLFASVPGVWYIRGQADHHVVRINGTYIDVLLDGAVVRQFDLATVLNSESLPILDGAAFFQGEIVFFFLRRIFRFNGFAFSPYSDSEFSTLLADVDSTALYYLDGLPRRTGRSNWEALPVGRGVESSPVISMALLDSLLVALDGVDSLGTVTAAWNLDNESEPVKTFSSPGRHGSMVRVGNTLARGTQQGVYTLDRSSLQWTKAASSGEVLLITALQDRVYWVEVDGRLYSWDGVTEPVFLTRILNLPQAIASGDRFVYLGTAEIVPDVEDKTIIYMERWDAVQSKLLPRVEIGEYPGVVGMGWISVVGDTVITSVNSKILRSTDNGVNWNLINQEFANFRNVVEQAGVLYGIGSQGLSNFLAISTDGGSSWRLIKLKLPHGQAAISLAVYRDNLYAGTFDGIYRASVVALSLDDSPLRSQPPSFTVLHNTVIIDNISLEAVATAYDILGRSISVYIHPDDNRIVLTIPKHRGITLVRLRDAAQSWLLKCVIE